METGVFYQLCKVKDLEKASKSLCEIMDMQKEKFKYYQMVAPDDAIIIQASVIDEWLMKSIETWKKAGYDVVIQSGKPGGPVCPPGQSCQ